MLKEECLWYTYFNQNDHNYHQMCFLQTELLEPTQNCEGNCVTGPKECSEKNCVLEMNGQSYQSIKLTNTEDVHNIRLNGPGLCNLRLLAVGGQWHR